MTPRPTAASIQPVKLPQVKDPFTDKPKMARAIDFTPAGDQFYLKHVEGQEVEIHGITPGTDAYGDCVDLLLVVPGEEELICVHVSGFLAGRLIGLRESVEAGECAYPLAARFDKTSIGGGKTVWSMS